MEWIKVKKLFFVLVLFTSYAQANKPNECIEFHVISNAPIGFINEQERPSGVHWDYLTELEKYTGICINKTLTPYARVWQSIKHGKHDGGIIFKSISRSNNIHYIAKIRTVKTVVIPINGIEIKDYNDLKKLIIGKTRGTHLSKEFDNDVSLRIVELNNYAQAAQMIKLGRIDAIAGSALVLSYQLNNYNLMDKVDLSQKLTLGEKEQWLQLSQKSLHIDKIPLLKQGIVMLQQDGSLDYIMNKYYGVNWQEINQ